jgi:hypothetical protein
MTPKTEEPLQAENYMPINPIEALKDGKFNDFLQGQIDTYNYRPIPEKGRRYKRTPLDGLKDEGKLNAESIRAEFVKIANKETNLSRAKRDAIISIIFETARQTIQFRKKETRT